MKKVYLDVNIYNRPFDDQGQVRIRLETIAIFSIMQRFLSQITYEKRDYLKLQDKLFEGMSVEEIYKKAKEYSEKKQKSKKA